MSAEEVAQLQVQLARLREQLQEEQLLRHQAEEAVEAIAQDRNRLQVCPSAALPLLANSHHSCASACIRA